MWDYANGTFSLSRLSIWRLAKKEKMSHQMKCRFMTHRHSWRHLKRRCGANVFLLLECYSDIRAFPIQNVALDPTSSSNPQRFSAAIVRRWLVERYALLSSSAWPRKLSRSSTY